MKKIFLLLAIFTSIIACKKDDEVKILTPEEQSKVDQDQIIEYMKTYKFEQIHVGSLLRHIEWQIVPITEGDTVDVVSLYDLMSENVIETNFNGVDYKMYYYIFEKGAGGESSSPKLGNRIYVDYNVFTLYRYEMDDRIDKTEFRIRDFVMDDYLYEGWNLGLPKFNSGNVTGLSVDDYREKADTPGRGILIVPSGLGSGSGSGVLRFDIVLYHNEEVNAG